MPTARQTTAIDDALRHADAVLTVLAEELHQDLPPMMSAAQGGATPRSAASRARAAGALRQLDATLPGLEMLQEDAETQATDSTRRAERAQAEGGTELAARAHALAADAERRASEYASEISAIRTLLREWSDVLSS
jgi:hypothetical protein